VQVEEIKDEEMKVPAKKVRDKKKEGAPMQVE